jgi:hypothetical protein
MNPLHESDLARQQARAWSEQLGALAAASPASRAPAAFTQFGAPPSGLSPRLSAILGRLRQRRRRQDLVADRLRAQEFIMGA